MMQRCAAIPVNWLDFGASAATVPQDSFGSLSA
jgi:hypothetical protein